MAAPRVRGALAPAPFLFGLIASGCVEQTGPAPVAPPPPAAALTAPRTAPAAMVLAAPAATATTGSLATACGFGAATVPVIKPVFGVAVGATGDPQIACFAWQTFIALSWPALAGSPGQPDPNAAFGSRGPATWETYKSPDEVFLANAAVPAPWAQSAVESTVPTALRSLRATRGLRLLRSRSMADPAHLSAFQRDLSSTTQVGDATLVDQAGKAVYYEIAMNQDQFEYIVQNTLYDGKQQVALASTSFIELPKGKTSYGPIGSIELKAAWKVLTTAEATAVPLRFHTMSALLPSSTTPVTVGLVGLHVVQRVPDFDQGIWSTFAQIDNCPAPGAVPAGASYSFYNAGCTTSCTPNQSATPPTPTQLQQVNAIPSSTAAINKAMVPLLEGTPWQYYQLLHVQWPRSPVAMKKGATIPLPNGTPNVTTLINPVLETVLQNPGTSCLGCHQYATTAGSDNFAASYAFPFENAQCKPADCRSPGCDPTKCAPTH